MTLIGLPGLYQNWLLSALTPGGEVFTVSDNNFLCSDSYIGNIQSKLSDFKVVDAKNTVNMYVNESNFVWYLYNFLEKTDGVGIQIENLTTDLLTKAPGTIAFDYLLTHFQKSYNINSHCDSEYLNNSLVEYFYFTLINDHWFKSRSNMQLHNCVNVEYDDFNSLEQLVNVCKGVPSFDISHFELRYSQLQSRNERYLKKKINFVNKVHAGAKLDILETAYVGSIIRTMTMTELDWFNPDFRHEMIRQYHHTICIHADSIIE